MSHPFSAPLTVGPNTRRSRLLRRLLAIKEAETSLLAYTRFTMPDITDPDDVRLSRYQVADHHKVIAQVCEMLAAGTTKRAIIVAPPRHGKTELATKRFLAHYSGRHPDKSLIFGTYNNDYAEDNGRAVRDIFWSQEHQQVFPNHRLKEGSEAASRLQTTAGGQLSFVGRGTAVTGRGGDGIIIDDPLKDRAEADSKTIRDRLWTWFTQVIMTRQMTDDCWVLIIQTRWHEDDLIGRLTDPTNPYYNEAEAKKWTVIHLPALALENDVMGRKPGEALWPTRFSAKWLEAQRDLDPRGFQALYQGKPSTDDGAFFKAEWIKEYGPADLPKNLRYYCASDHAVSTATGRDKTALIPVGVDEDDNIYILPDVFWRSAAADVSVDAMVGLMKKHKPIFWWAERGAISKAIGPFLRKRMMEEKAYTALIELTPTGDKQARASSIQGRMAMGKVFFPKHASWWPDARDQLLKFPFAAHDDFVDALAYIGLGLNMQVSAKAISRAKGGARPGTFGWLFGQTRAQEMRDAAERDSAGF